MSGAAIPMWLPWLGGLAVKSLIVFLVAGLALLALRRASAAARHLVCLLTLAALLALPVLSLALPGWRCCLRLMSQGRETHPASQVRSPLPKREGKEVWLRPRVLSPCPPVSGGPL